MFNGSGINRSLAPLLQIYSILCRLTLGFFFIGVCRFQILRFQLYEVCKMGGGFQRGRIMWKVSFLATVWTIWGKRNMQFLQGKSSNELLLVDKVKFLVAYSITLFLNFRTSLLLQSYKNGRKYFSPPQLSLISYSDCTLLLMVP